MQNLDIAPGFSIQFAVPIRAYFLMLLAFFALVVSCAKESNQTPSAPSATETTTPAPGIVLPQVDQRICTAVAILVDTSGSMEQKVRDQSRRMQPKSVIARDALRKIVDVTEHWSAAHPDRPLMVGIYSFSSSASPVLPVGLFNSNQAQTAVTAIPAPGGGTAIGDALQGGFKALYASGCVRKHIVCITDGENTSGPAPNRVARDLFTQTGGEVELHFVAFDTSAEKFGFLKDVNGHVVEAADGEQLSARLTEIYERRILAEAMPAEKP